MEISFDFSEVYNLGAMLTNAGQTARQQAELVVAKSAHDLEAQSKANIVAMGAVDTGAMLNSTTSDVNGLHAEIGPTVNYAHFVHDGTAFNGGPRPFNDNAAATIEPQFLAAMEQVVGGVFS